ncbi:DUF7310 family coiled-coil domain-containing protein [Natrarchaeobius halalkaliphilus]|uniref:DUF7310 family coiled-coil domain-containing protein n=1 Tax=Natrarchaeobius halalkaliphilus TaxID=1679091 RepID=UPI000F531D32|nr:hypothetical protein [Natrarchaeobius halalkaliphilus]
MTDTDRIEQRLSALERTVIDGDFEADELADRATIIDDLERLESRLDSHEGRLADVEGRMDAVAGFVGRIDAVNDDVEREATTALAVVDRLETRLDALENRLEDGTVARNPEASVGSEAEDGPDPKRSSALDEQSGKRRFRERGTKAPEDVIDELQAELDTRETGGCLTETDPDIRERTTDAADQHLVDRRFSSTENPTADDGSNTSAQSTATSGSGGLLGSLLAPFR